MSVKRLLSTCESDLLLLHRLCTILVDMHAVTANNDSTHLVGCGAQSHYQKRCGVGSSLTQVPSLGCGSCCRSPELSPPLWFENVTLVATGPSLFQECSKNRIGFRFRHLRCWRTVFNSPDKQMLHVCLSVGHKHSCKNFKPDVLTD